METNSNLKSDWRDMLRARVIRNEAVQVLRSNEDGSLEVELPFRQRWFMLKPFSLIFPFRKGKKIRLDPIGSELFGACSQKRTVESIIDWFAAEERLSFHESRMTVSNYLRILMQEGLLAIERRNK